MDDGTGTVISTAMFSDTSNFKVTLDMASHELSGFVYIFYYANHTMRGGQKVRAVAVD